MYRKLVALDDAAREGAERPAGMGDPLPQEAPVRADRGAVTGASVILSPGHDGRVHRHEVDTTKLRERLSETGQRIAGQCFVRSVAISGLPGRWSG